MKRTYLFLFIIFVFIIMWGAKFGKKARYVVATSPNNPPMEMVDTDKNISGFDIDVISRIAEHQKITIKFVPVLKENIYHGLIDESYDIAISSLTLRAAAGSAESMNIIFSEPYLEIGEVVVISEDFERYTGPESLRGLWIGISQDSPSGQLFTEDFGINTKEYINIENAFEDMASGKIHALSINLPHASRMVNLNDEYRGIFKIIPEPITSEKYVIAVKKGNTKLLSMINSGLEALKNDGTLESLIDTWFFTE
ncbi:MAG: amino acid ABC transporter substrate-binding protein [Spirochaetota bacterium]|nr:MAG: amino acid ABC transporter substrate-binding protein [Spirochaetota bacterium]